MSVSATVAGEFQLLKENVVFYEDDRELDRGKLYIKETSLDWEGQNRQFSLMYPNISLHAISRNPFGGDDNVKFPLPHVFVLVEGERVWSNGEPLVSASGDNEMEVDAEEESEDEEQAFPNDEESPTFVLRFVPAHDRDLDEIYDAIAECQAMNPDPEDISGEEFEGIEEEEDDGPNEEPENSHNGNGFDPANFADD